MKKIITLLFVVLTTSAWSQEQYEKGMQKAFSLWGEGKSAEASNLFERISNVEQDNWLPYYYVAQINTINSFGEKDEKLLKQQLDKAQEFLDIAKRISPNNPEIIVQQAMTYTAWIAYDGATYGMTHSGKVVALYNEALKIAPENPRVVLSKAEWDMGSAKYFGQDTAPFCNDIERSLELFANFKPEGPFFPNWGEDRAKVAMQQCKG